MATVLLHLETSIPTAFIALIPFYPISFKLAATVFSLPIQITWSHEYPIILGFQWFNLPQPNATAEGWLTV
jgi:hypothetical protein